MDAFSWLQSKVPEGLPEIGGPLQRSRVPDVPGRTRDVRIVLKLDVLVEVAERLGLIWVIEVDFSEAVESAAELVEDPKILFLR
jgi:hypothetical protein